jgi:hypothetical protein
MLFAPANRRKAWGGKPLKKVYLAYALLALVVILLLYAQLSHAPA